MRIPFATNTRDAFRGLVLAAEGIFPLITFFTGSCYQEKHQDGDHYGNTNN